MLYSTIGFYCKTDKIDFGDSVNFFIQINLKIFNL